MLKVGKKQDTQSPLTLAESQQIGVVEPGLPGPLPHGERIVWQGTPHRGHFARRALSVWFLLGFTCVLALIYGAHVLETTGSIGGAGFVASMSLVGGGVFIMIAMLIGLAMASSTIYTITNRRVLMRIGVAFTATIDLPFAAIESIHHKNSKSDLGDIQITVAQSRRVPFFVLWPHVRLDRALSAWPVLKSIAGSSRVARILVDQVAEAHKLAANRETDIKHNVIRVQAVQTAQVPQRQKSKLPGMVPRAAMIVVILTLSLFVVGGQFSSKMHADRMDDVVVGSVSVQRVSGEDSNITIVDPKQNVLVSHVSENGEGLLQGAMRALDRNRMVNNRPATGAYEILFWETGAMTFSDRELDKHIPISSFGPFGSGSMNDLAVFQAQLNVNNLPE